MNEQTYNGWANYPTWNLMLWIDNEEPLHRVPVEILKICVGMYDEEAAKLTPFSRELRMDYTSVEFDGVTYWVR